MMGNEIKAKPRVRQSRQYRKNIIIALFLAMLYCGSYFILSRRGFVLANASNMEGFYFAQPDRALGDWSQIVHSACTWGYSPLIQLDTAFGTGRPPSKWPMSSLE